jgi:hypothetical protein
MQTILTRVYISQLFGLVLVLKQFEKQKYLYLNLFKKSLFIQYQLLCEKQHQQVTVNDL